MTKLLVRSGCCSTGILSGSVYMPLPGDGISGREAVVQHLQAQSSSAEKPVVETQIGLSFGIGGARGDALQYRYQFSIMHPDEFDKFGDHRMLDWALT